MKTLILLAGATVLAVSVPAAADPGKSHGKGKQATMKQGQAHHAKAHDAKARSAKSLRGIVKSDRYGRMYALNTRETCPPGLDKRQNGCMAPGQAKRTYNVGQRYNRNFGNMWTYNQIPEYLQSRYTLDQSDRYYYRNGYLYQVDPKTMLVQQVISALLR